MKTTREVLTAGKCERYECQYFKQHIERHPYGNTTVPEVHTYCTAPADDLCPVITQYALDPGTGHDD